MSEKISALDFKQGENIILLFNLSAGDLKELSYFNTRDIDRIDGLQRTWDDRRSKAIAGFLNTENAILANNIIINLELEKNGLTLSDIFSNKQIDIGKLKNTLQKKDIGSEHHKIAFVVDGQHRLRAFEQINKDDYQLPVSALIDLSLAEVAELFVQINYNQKPVNKSHVFDLLGISEDIFPKYYRLHKAVVLLQEDSSSPFYNNIKMLGVGKGFISQASLITAMEKYKLEAVIENLKEDECTADDLFNVMWNFFDAVKASFPEQWGDKKIFSKTVGIRALINLLRDILIIAEKNDDEFSSQFIQNIFNRIDITLFEREELSHLVGEQGVGVLYKTLKEALEL